MRNAISKGKALYLFMCHFDFVYMLGFTVTNVIL